MTRLQIAAVAMLCLLAITGCPPSAAPRSAATCVRSADVAMRGVP